MKRQESTEASGLYLLQDGTHASPGDVSKGKDGVLRHKNGLAVCLYENGEPQTVGKDAVNNKNVDAAKMDEPADEDEAVEDAAGSDVNDSAAAKPKAKAK
jgi:hypothetical protein